MKPRLRRWSPCSRRAVRDELKREIQRLTGLDTKRVEGEAGDGMIARSDYVFTRNGGRNGRENSLGSAVPRTAVRLFELCMDTACLQRVLFALPDPPILEASPRARMTSGETYPWSHGRRWSSNLNSALFPRPSAVTLVSRLYARRGYSNYSADKRGKCIFINLLISLSFYGQRRVS